VKPAAALALVVALPAALGCGRTRGAIGVPQGKERGACYPNGTCDTGLTCFSDRCVRYGDDGAAPPPDATPTGTGGAVAGGQGGRVGTGGRGGQSGGGAGGTAGSDAAADGPPDVAGARDAGPTFCDGAATGPTETIVAQACGFNPGTTSTSYSGFVRLTVSGVLVNTGTVGQDAFYSVDTTNASVALAACPGCFRYNRRSEGMCVCSYECAATSHEVAGLLVGAYPDFRPDHVYSVVLDLGPSADRLDLGMADCGCNDNSGNYILDLTPLTVGTCSP
jgi:hypothetical protein